MDVALVEQNLLDIQLVGDAPCLVQVKVSSLALVQVESAICCACKKFFGSLEQMVAWPPLTDDFRVLLNASYCA